MSLISVKTYSPPAVNMREVYRYAGCVSADEAVAALAQECIEEADKALSFRVCYGIFPIEGDVSSDDLRLCLSGCSRVIVFAATVGIGIDRLIMKYGKTSPAKALFMQAYGAERIESLCDEFCRDMKDTLRASLKPRFSPGYGDLPLQVQSDIFRVLDCERKIGLTLNSSLLMSPTKSVTAIVGIKDGFQRIFKQ